MALRERKPIKKNKYLPSYSKEWKNIVYYYNKKNFEPRNTPFINKIIKSYFNLYLMVKKRLLKTIYLSNPLIKYTNNKAFITLYLVNQEKNILLSLYLKNNNKISLKFLRRYIYFYKKNLYLIYLILNKHKDFSLTRFQEVKNLYLKKMWSIIISKYWKRYFLLLRKYDLLYSLNQYKFNKTILLPILKDILNKLIGKKIEYNIINLKSIAYNTDIFTNVLARKLKKPDINYMKSIFSILNRAYLPLCHKDKNQPSLINNIIYNSINYKNMRGIRLEVKGRLSKRYRADRSVHFLKWKGGLKNADLRSSVLYRGNTKSNTSYSIYKSKRRIGAFAVKGWISG